MHQTQAYSKIIRTYNKFYNLNKQTGFKDSERNKIQSIKNNIKFKVGI